MSYRDDLAALDARVASLRGEVAETEKLALDARRLVRQHVIEAELATPCTALWAEMQGDDRIRHCNHCNKNVYNFSELTRDQIDAVILKTEGKLCGRLFLRADGSILTKDCKRDVRIRPSRANVGLGVGVMTAAALLAGAAVASQMAARPDRPAEEYLQYDGLMSLEITEEQPRSDTNGPYDYQGGVSISSEPRDH